MKTYRLQRMPSLSVFGCTVNVEFCLPEGARIEHRELERRKPYVFTFCFTQSYSPSFMFIVEMEVKVLEQALCFMNY